MPKRNRLATPALALVSLIRRMEKHSTQQHNGCVVWMAGRMRGGYGKTHYWNGEKTVTLLAHRAAYAVHHGLPLQFDGLVCHKCDTPACINPEHLFLGTTADNIADKVAKERQQRGERAHGAKLTAAKVRAIRADGRSQSQIANTYGISQATVSEIKLRNAWRHVM